MADTTPEVMAMMKLDTCRSYWGRLAGAVISQCRWIARRFAGRVMSRACRRAKPKVVMPRWNSSATIRNGMPRPRPYTNMSSAPRTAVPEVRARPMTTLRVGPMHGVQLSPNSTPGPTRRYLVVVIVPGEQPADWYGHGQGFTVFKKAVYWRDLLTAPSTTNTTKIAVRIPLANRYTPRVVQDHMAAAREDFRRQFGLPGEP